MSRKNLTVAEERFCLEYIKHRNGAEAHRTAFPLSGKNGGPNYHAAKASELRSRPEVQARINELAEKAAEMAVISAKEVLQRWMAIAFADPRELVEVKTGCCRYCHGVGFKYQWREREAEEEINRIDKVNENLKRNQFREEYPTFEGGFGFQEFAAPNPECPECGGEGQPRVVVKDTSNLSPEGLALYGGAKMTRNGLEVIIADRQKAFENVSRIMGLFTDNVKLSGELSTMAAIVDMTDMSAEDAAEAYKKMLRGMAV